MHHRRAPERDSADHGDASVLVTPGVEYCRSWISHFDLKAGQKKREALSLFAAAISGSLAAPLFITLGQGELLGKIVPAVLSTLAAVSSAWLQQRNPQRLWALYRTAQRQLEYEAVQYEFRLSEYGDTDKPEKLLAQKASTIVLQTHTNWLPIVPSTPPAKQPPPAGHSNPDEH
jgi:hypothetical protein